MYRLEELLIVTIATMLDGLGHVAVGAASPVPGAAALLARARSQGSLRVSLLGSRRHNAFTDGGKELFDCAAQGRIDAFFLGGAQIDGEANINLVGVGGYPKAKARFPGSFGSSYLYFLVPRVILFSLEHSPRVMVPRVDFVSAPGVSPDGIYRPGGPYALVTNRCVFAFDRKARRFRLLTAHPGEDLNSIRGNTGFDFDAPERVPETPVPGEAELGLLGGQVGREIAEVYPTFARRLWNIEEPSDNETTAASTEESIGARFHSIQD
ncbi:MAG TPA: CoA-transferase [Gammaproteobacteria bacterium]|nr:CoA-transferase [Gammaproteobacteria bacterium]